MLGNILADFSFEAMKRQFRRRGKVALWNKRKIWVRQRRTGYLDIALRGF